MDVDPVFRKRRYRSSYPYQYVCICMHCRGGCIPAVSILLAYTTGAGRPCCRSCWTLFNVPKASKHSYLLLCAHMHILSLSLSPSFPFSFSFSNCCCCAESVGDGWRGGVGRSPASEDRGEAEILFCFGDFLKFPRGSFPKGRCSHATVPPLDLPLFTRVPG